jgi:hypothetical protein
MQDMGMRAIKVALLGIAAVGLLTGCGPATATVSGEVLVDGVPMPSGIISFVPAEGTGQPVTANIQAGRYQAKTLAGKMVVQISQPVVVGKKPQYNGPDAPMMEMTQENLPPRYHSSSELKVELTPGSNTQDWSVKSVKAAS